jgi:hypothetical protein
MSDDIDDAEFVGGIGEIGVDMPDSRSEWHDWSAPSGDNGTIIFPRGVEQFADDNDVQLVRISGKTGMIEVLQELGGSWRAVDRPPRQAALKAIGGDKS